MPAFREFSVVFHDELKTFYADEFAELGREFTLAGVGDGFAVNYGASGMGAILLANRKGIGPSKDCVECAYEEFFLEPWANGDPALLSDYEDDPSNVHHSYLNDRIIFRNLHAGPKETHVFHLHAHQWLAQDSDTGTYLDSQTIAPQQGFSYEIYYGGSGNRNLTPGDSIFHCHLYPHFAQGMWELWRVHDVLEDGSRRLPDGELKAADGRSGTDPLTGEIPPLAGFSNKPSGTPIPAVIPLPGQAMPPEPTYLQDEIAAAMDGFPGYPFYVAGAAGHRAPQAPLDIHEPAGLGRHVVQCPKDKQGVSLCQRMVSGIPAEKAKTLNGDEILQHALLTSDFSVHMERARLLVLPDDGTPLEKIAMAFHSRGQIETVTPEGMPGQLIVNDSEPKPGAPFADPCRGWTFASQTFGIRTRRYDLACQDRTIRTVFTHDHFAPSSIQQHGFYAALLVEPRKAKFLRPDGGDMDEPQDDGCKPGEQEGVFKSCAVGTQAMIVIGDDGTEQAGGNYREFALAVADFALLYDGNHRSPPLGLKDFALLPESKQQAPGPLHHELKRVQQRYGHPVDPPKMPEAISKDHHNPYLVNYKHEPLPLRIGCKHYGPAGEDSVDAERCGTDSIRHQRPGIKGDMAYVFSSWEHGDPATEIFAGYEGEKVQLRVIQGAQEVQHVLNIHGQHWPREIGNPNSPLVAAQEIGISEHFEMQLMLGNVTRKDPFTDYLYNFGSVDDLWNGAWGFIRSFESFLDCDTLADDADRQKCHAALAKMECGSGELQDCLKPLPGVPRDEEGRLVLQKNAAMADAPGDALMPKIVPLNVEKNVDQGEGGDVRPSAFVSLHPQLLEHNTALSDGAMVGYQIGKQLADPPASPGKSPFVEYFWYAGTVAVEGNKLMPKSVELGPVNLVSYGDIINHPTHGLIGALIIEPEGATYHDPETGEALQNGAGIRAEIRYPGGGRFKEFVVFYRDGLNLYYGAQGEGIPVPDCRVCDDSYDLGEKGINYSSAPFWLRLGQAPRQKPGAEPRDPWFLPDLNGAYFPRQFFSEALNQAIPTPRFTANKGDEVRFRVLQPSGRARQRSFLVYGHDYPDLLPYFGSPHAPLISVGKAITAKIDSANPGYWLYRDGPTQIWAGGAWGIIDVRSSE